MASWGGVDNEAQEAYLRPRWSQLCKELGVASVEQAKWWNTLVQRYSEPQRAYHTLEHLRELFVYMEEHKARITDARAVSLAIFFHDIVYSPLKGSPRNEQDSAVIFDFFGQECLPAGQPWGLDKDGLITKVRRWIVMTATHKVGEGEDEDCKLFMDFDMAILGAKQERYEEYSKQIRQEYIHIPLATFCKARSGFLAAVVEGTSSIFASQLFRASHEDRARDNMAREAAHLKVRFAECGLLWRLVAYGSLSSRLRVFAKGGGGCFALAGLAAVGVFKPTWALAGGALGLGAFLAVGAKLAFGAKYVRHPYPEPTSKSGTVVLAASYNPPHNGHLAMLKYLSKAHTRVVAVVGVNPNKVYAVGPYQRLEILKSMVNELGLDNVEVVVWSSLIFLYAHSIGASLMYRGIRTWAQDGRDEKMLEAQNLFYQPVCGYWPIPTAYLQGDPQLVEVSSSLLRSSLKDGRPITDLVPSGCAQAVRAAYSITLPGEDQ